MGSQQISFREKPELFDEIKAAAKSEDLQIADFVRKIFRIGFVDYLACGSLHALRARQELAQAARKAVDEDKAAERKVDRELESRSQTKKNAKSA